MTPVHVPTAEDVTVRPVSATRRRMSPVLDYVGVSLLIMLPLWRPGYLLMADTIFAPHLRFTTEPLISMQPISTVLSALNLVLPSQIIEKLLYTMILVLAGWGMHRLVAVETRAARYFAGLLGVFNPFVYDHIMYGQWTVVLGYALLPWLLASLRVVCACPRPASAGVWQVALLATVITILSLPMGVIAVAMVSGVVACHLALSPAWLRRSLLALSLKMALAWLLLNAFWLLPVLVTPGAAVIRVLQFPEAELTAFATVSDPVWGAVLTVLGGQGFWAESSGRFVTLRQVIAFWPIEPLGLLGLAAVGLWATPHGWRARSMSLALGLCLVAATVLALGVSTPLSAPLTRFLFTHSAVYHGLRDTQKWDALVLLAEITLAAAGFDSLMTRLQRKWRHGATVAWAPGVIAPPAFVPLLLWGCAGQLRPVNYPTSWFAANAALVADKTTFQTLFLPWHLYMSFPFTGRVIANPAQGFFDVPIIQGDNMEMPGLFSDMVDPRGASLGAALTGPRVDARTVSRALTRFDIKYVLLAVTVDWERYGFLGHTPNLRLIHRWPDLLLYRNTSWRG